MSGRSVPATTTAAWISRVSTLADALGRPRPSDVDKRSLAAAIGELVNARDREEIWLALAVLTGRFPNEELVLQTARSSEFDPTALFRAIRDETTPESAEWTVVVERNKILVDVADTSTSTVSTGIQRVVREVAKRWIANDTVRFAGWTPGWQSLRELQPAELSRVKQGVARARDEEDPAANAVVVVPWRTTYLLLEVSAEPPRAERVRALARFSGCHTAALCYDVIPITSSETSSPGMTGVFAHYMAALKFFDRVSTISRATAVEYLGWRKMLPAAGLTGPEIVPVLLPASVGESDENAFAAARDRLTIGQMPLVIVVGSHEPRKNHLAILHAAEVLWREGHVFSLSFIGSRSWRSEQYHDRIRQLQDRGRPVESVSQADDTLLWAAYRLARFTVFPSLNEGFGLPVAESLAVGTPVITSQFGSTAEIAEHGGALLIDPRDDDDLTAAMRTLLTDEDTLGRLRAEARARPQTSWDQYARDVWEALV
ncbi:glycosyltransferase family 4 protein [Microbacterium sp. VKM Ac-2870]|uniref:glycosyltransferase family 4 protein n=1 Tax=Microbacterium sp. VKM Ac-2870 TaxID=2783825 RepID=UPI00188A6746|nr:glycosyltransferase family 1 protein [Microbacterium sp. VKM Ac-2870]MBF4561677.1 glycosyltransferase family 4 protein [Microbacterium sp. VKM Ac-2870]